MARLVGLTVFGKGITFCLWLTHAPPFPAGDFCAQCSGKRAALVSLVTACPQDHHHDPSYGCSVFITMCVSMRLPHTTASVLIIARLETRTCVYVRSNQHTLIIPHREIHLTTALIIPQRNSSNYYTNHPSQGIQLTTTAH